MNIVAFKLSPLGDTVLFLPVVQALRREHPTWRVTLFATPLVAPLLGGVFPPNEVVAMPTENLRRAWRRPWRLIGLHRKLRQLRPDAVLLSYDQPSVARFLGRVSGARIRVAGTAAAVRWQGGATHRVEKLAGHSLAEWDWEMGRQMMKELGQSWADGPPAPVLPVSYARASATQAHPRVIIHPGASRPYQRWHPDRFAALAEALCVNHEVLWIDHPEFAGTPPAGVFRVAPANTLALLQQLSTADLFVGNHSGAFHLSAALGIPCVVVAGPSPYFCDPPWHADRRRILRAPALACLPCDQLTVSAQHCRNVSAPLACMSHWDVATVMTVCRDLLHSHRSRQGVAGS